MITKAQIIAIRTCLNKLGIEVEKDSLVLQYTSNRTSSLKEMQYKEAQQLLNALGAKPNTVDASVKRMRGNITAMAYELCWITKDNYTRLNDWMLTHSYLKKGMFEYTKEELPKLVSQFKVVYSKTLNKI